MKFYLLTHLLTILYLTTLSHTHHLYVIYTQQLGSSAYNPAITDRATGFRFMLAINQPHCYIRRFYCRAILGLSISHRPAAASLAAIPRRRNTRQRRIVEACALRLWNVHTRLSQSHLTCCRVPPVVREKMPTRIITTKSFCYSRKLSFIEPQGAAVSTLG